MRFTLAVLCRVLLVAAVGIAALTSRRCQADAPLRWRFAVGETLDYQLAQDMNMNVDAGPAGPMATAAAQTMNITWNVKSIDDQGDAVIEQKIGRIRLKMTVPGGQGFDYDTDSEEPAVGMAAMIAPTIEAMTAGGMLFTMSPRGETREIKISDELSAAVQNGPGGDTGAVEQFKSIVSQLAFVLPENLPKTGESWSTKIAISALEGGDQTVETTYTYDGTREADGTTYAVIKPSMKGQKVDGEVLFDLQVGRLHSMSINRSITRDVAAAGQTMPATIDQKIDITMLPKED